MQARRAAGLAAAGMVVLLAGCGSRTPAPQLLRPAASGGLKVNRYPQAGFRLGVPRTWTPVRVRLPLVALITSGPAVISLWRYPRSGAQPGTPAQLREALGRLIAAARSRGHTLRVLGSSTVTVAGLPAAQLETVQRIGSAIRQVQSTHVYGRGEELVLEEYAPVGLFSNLDRSVFAPVRRSLTPLGLH
jgi:hypothetical protein